MNLALVLTELSEACLLVVGRVDEASALTERLRELSCTHTGHGFQAHAELSAAIDLYRAMDMTFWLPQAEAALAQVGDVLNPHPNPLPEGEGIQR